MHRKLLARALVRQTPRCPSCSVSMVALFYCCGVSPRDVPTTCILAVALLPLVSATEPTVLQTGSPPVLLATGMGNL